MTLIPNKFLVITRVKHFVQAFKDYCGDEFTTKFAAAFTAALAGSEFLTAVRGVVATGRKKFLVVTPADGAAPAAATLLFNETYAAATITFARGGEGAYTGTCSAAILSVANTMASYMLKGGTQQIQIVITSTTAFTLKSFTSAGVAEDLTNDVVIKFETLV